MNSLTATELFENIGIKLMSKSHDHIYYKGIYRGSDIVIDFYPLAKTYSVHTTYVIEPELHYAITKQILEFDIVNTNHIFKCPECGCEVRLDSNEVKLIGSSTVFAMLGNPQKQIIPIHCPNCPQTTLFNVGFDIDGNITEIEVN